VVVLGDFLEICEVTSFLFLFYRLDSVMCLGVTAGAYILTLFAVCIFFQAIGLYAACTKLSNFVLYCRPSTESEY